MRFNTSTAVQFTGIDTGIVQNAMMQYAIPVHVMDSLPWHGVAVLQLSTRNRQPEHRAGRRGLVHW